MEYLKDAKCLQLITKIFEGGVSSSHFRTPLSGTILSNTQQDVTLSDNVGDK